MNTSLQLSIARALMLLAIFGSWSRLNAAEAAPTNPEFFEKDIRPLINNYCLKCHSTEKHKGDMDLEQFSSISEVIRQPKVWQAVAEQLGNNEMPPREKPQPTQPERERLLGWV